MPCKTRCATLKKITMPVTSTSVATNGAEQTAGSSRIKRKNIGSIAPAKLPHKTTQTKLKPTVNASN